jgi:hypothetical protein
MLHIETGSELLKIVRNAKAYYFETQSETKPNMHQHPNQFLW